MPETYSGSPRSEQFTRHAAARCRQRGVRDEDVQFLIKHGDFVLPARQGSEQIMLSHATAIALIAEGCPVAEVQRARSLCVIVHGDQIITVYPHTARRPAHRRSRTRARTRTQNRGKRR